MRLTKPDWNAYELRKLRARTAKLEAAVVALVNLVEDMCDPHQDDVTESARAARDAVNACLVKGD